MGMGLGALSLTWSSRGHAKAVTKSENGLQNQVLNPGKQPSMSKPFYSSSNKIKQTVRFTGMKKIIHWGNGMIKYSPKMCLRRVNLQQNLSNSFLFPPAVWAHSLHNQPWGKFIWCIMFPHETSGASYIVHYNFSVCALIWNYVLNYLLLNYLTCPTSSSLNKMVTPGRCVAFISWYCAPALNHIPLGTHVIQSELLSMRIKCIKLREYSPLCREGQAHA